MIRKNEYGVGDVNFTTLMDTVDKTRIGFHAVSLTNFDNTSAPAIAAGSVIEVNGALFSADVEESITGSPSDGTVYIKIIPDDDEATAEYTNTAPEWDSEKQGWYSPTAGEENYRYLEYVMVKSSSTYIQKAIFLKSPIGNFITDFNKVVVVTGSLSGSAITNISYPAGFTYSNTYVISGMIEKSSTWYYLHDQKPGDANYTITLNQNASNIVIYVGSQFQSTYPYRLLITRTS